MGAYTLATVNSEAYGGGSTTLNPTSSQTSGRLALMFTAAAAMGSVTTSVTAGWTEVAARSGHTKIYARILDGTSADNPTVTFSDTSIHFAQIAEFTGDIHTNLGTIVHVEADTFATATVPGVPNITITQNDCLVIIAGSHNKSATSNGATYNDVANFTEIDENRPTGTQLDTVWNYWQQTTATSLSGVTRTMTGTTESQTATGLSVALLSAAAAAAPGFDTNPTVTAQTDTTYTLAYESDSAATLYVVAVPAGASTPSAAQIKAGTGGGIVAATSEATTGSADTVNLTITGDPFPKYKLCALLSNINGDSSIVALDNEFLDPPTGFSFTTIAMREISAITQASPASITCTGHGLSSGNEVRIWGITGDMGDVLNNLTHTVTVSDANTFTVPVDTTGLTYTSGGFVSFGESVLEDASPSAADGDILVGSSATSPQAYSITWASDGVPSWDPDGDESRTSFQARFYDASAAAYSDASPVTFYVNNLPPFFVTGDLEELAVYFFPEDVAITPIDLSALAEDPEADAITVTAVDSLPTGLSISGGTTLEGTPTTQAISEGVVLRWTDSAGDYIEGPITFVVGNITVPDVEGLDVAQGAADLEAVYLTPDIIIVTGTEEVDGTILDQIPSAGSSVDPLSTVQLYVAGDSDLLEFLMQRERSRNRRVGKDRAPARIQRKYRLR